MADRKTELQAPHPSRNYGIDALRILSMLMIVVLHVLKYGGILGNTEIYSAKYETAWLLEVMAFGAVDCFALISGYVGVYSKNKCSNLGELWLRVLFYSVIITVAFLIFAPETVGAAELIGSLFPAITGKYWYFTAYFLLFFFIPMLNHALNALSKRRMKWILILVLATVTAALPLERDPFVLKAGYSSLWLMILYLLGGYIRKYGLLTRAKSYVFLLCFFGFSVVTWLSKLAIQLVTQRVFGEIKYEDTMISYISITVLGAAVSLLLFFERVNIKSAVWIKLISFATPLVFSVYLIHTHPLVFNHVITDTFAWAADLPLYFMIPAALGISLGIFAACVLIDYVRHGLFRWMKVKEKLCRCEAAVKARIIQKEK